MLREGGETHKSTVKLFFEKCCTSEHSDANMTLHVTYLHFEPVQRPGRTKPVVWGVLWVHHFEQLEIRYDKIELKIKPTRQFGGAIAHSLSTSCQEFLPLP